MACSCVLRSAGKSTRPQSAARRRTRKQTQNETQKLGNIAPQQKKAMYLGFSQLPIGIGWSLEGFLGQYLYGMLGAKDTLSRAALVEHGMAPADADAVPIGEAFEKLVEVTGQSADALTAELYAAHGIGAFWYIMGSVGVVAAAGMYAYGIWTYRLKDG